MSDRFDHTLEHTLDTKADADANAGVTAVRRIELITGPGSYSGRRRQWSQDDKARVVIESLKPGTNVSEVARRHGLSPQQLFRLRRGEMGHHHHIAGPYLLRYAQEAAWREDNRRVSNGDQVRRVAGLALRRGKSADFTGYWQRHTD